MTVIGLGRWSSNRLIWPRRMCLVEGHEVGTQNPVPRLQLLTSCQLTLGFSDGAGNANEVRCGSDRADEPLGATTMGEA